MGERIHRDLIKHGIQDEASDFRAHVCVKAELLYVLATEDALAMIETGRWRKTTAMTNGVITSEGFLLPVSHIPKCRTLRIPANLLEEVSFQEADDTSARGAKAQTIVERFVREGWLKFPCRCGAVNNVCEQIAGTDLFVSFTARVQVKCDWNGGGPGIHGCTGNLYIETGERNPYKRH